MHTPNPSSVRRLLEHKLCLPQPDSARTSTGSSRPRVATRAHGWWLVPVGYPHIHLRHLFFVWTGGGDGAAVGNTNVYSTTTTNPPRNPKPPARPRVRAAAIPCVGVCVLLRRYFHCADRVVDHRHGDRVGRAVLPVRGYGDFDIIFEHFSRISQLCTTPLLCNTIY